MRGTPERMKQQGYKYGIIPADAGNTLMTSLFDLTAQDHPRGCGEHEQLADRVIRGEGSSPRMRGTPSGWDGH